MGVAEPADAQCGGWRRPVSTPTDDAAVAAYVIDHSYAASVGKAGGAGVRPAGLRLADQYRHPVSLAAREVFVATLGQVAAAENRDPGEGLAGYDGSNRVPMPVARCSTRPPSPRCWCSSCMRCNACRRWPCCPRERFVEMARVGVRRLHVRPGVGAQPWRARTVVACTDVIGIHAERVAADDRAVRWWFRRASCPPAGS